jgi:hypothetical protein
MPQFHADGADVPPSPLYLPCPKCGRSMFLSRVEPTDKPDYDRRIFQCATCGVEESKVVKFK